MLNCANEKKKFQQQQQKKNTNTQNAYQKLEHSIYIYECLFEMPADPYFQILTTLHEIYSKIECVENYTIYTLG